jgi:hypothetical protein
MAKSGGEGLRPSPDTNCADEGGGRVAPGSHPAILADLLNDTDPSVRWHATTNPRRRARAGPWLIGAGAGPAGRRELDALLQARDITGGPGWLIDMLASPADVCNVGPKLKHIDHGGMAHPGPEGDAHSGPVLTTEARRLSVAADVIGGCHRRSRSRWRSDIPAIGRHVIRRSPTPPPAELLVDRRQDLLTVGRRPQ